MASLTDAFQQWVAKSRERIDGMPLEPQLVRTGRIVQAGDGVVILEGLPDTRLDERLEIEGGAVAQAVDLAEGSIGCVLLGDSAHVAAGNLVKGTGDVMRVPVGQALLGRVVDALGRPLDGGRPIAAEAHVPVERPAPAIVDRALVERPLSTGVLVLDATLPLGRGQRELIIGDRATGKTALAVDTIIRQRASDVICVYAAIGQKASSVARVIDAVRRYGAPQRCIFVVGEADAAPGLQWITPYAACSMAEHFMEAGCDVLLVLDDLTKHAAVYREISLLLRRPPGREAYPGDIFYIHSRLLERAAKLAPERGGGSLTALPIAETQAGNLSAYIPTNLISITDGQIYLEPRLFQENQKPAVDVGRSVSRVGGKAQAAAVKALAERLRLEYAQFLELEVFTRFGTLVDVRTRRIIEHGRRIRAVFTQSQFAPLSVGEEVALLLALAERLLDDIPLECIGAFRDRLHEWLSAREPQTLELDDRSPALSQEARARLKDVLALLARTVGAEPQAAAAGSHAQGGP